MTMSKDNIDVGQLKPGKRALEALHNVLLGKSPGVGLLS